ncbi:MAG TPA: ABC transporter permease [Blastocatellia bacterium]|nr:ABC transporter permease [Blastocatellia bacterium]
MNTLWQDFRYSVRLLRKNLSFTAVAVLMLAMGIGANTAIFQLINAVRLRTLPVKNPQELFEARIVDMTRARGSWSSWHATATYPLWEQIRDNQQSFSSVFAWATDRWVNLASGGEARFAQTLWVSGDFFNTLGVQPILGRGFTDEEDQRGCGSPRTVISYSFWQREFGGDPSIVGRTVKLEGHPFEILGVTPASFFGLEVGQSFDVALPICAQPVLFGEDARLGDGTHWWLSIVGRLKPGWSPEQASASLDAISSGVFAKSLTPNYPAEDVKSYLAFKLTAVPVGSGVSQLREEYGNPLWLLLAIAGLVLLIACANLANLMLARASAREREIAVRLALGASRARLIRQLLVESLLIASAGAALAVLIAGDLSSFIVSFVSTEGNPLFVALETDWHVVAFTTGVAILTCALFGLTPAVRVTRLSPNDVLKAGGRGLTANRERFGLRRVLVVSQIALSLVLAVGALLFSRSLQKLMTLQVGFQQDGLLVMYVNPGDMKIPPDRRLSYKKELLDRVRSVPGVEAAAETNVIPLSGSSWSNKVWMEGSEPEQGTNSYISVISPAYFETLGTTLSAGRDFDERDALNSPRVAIVNESFARQFTNGTNPIGRRFWVEATPSDPKTLYEIVGLAKDAKYRDLREDVEPVFFRPMSQNEHAGEFTQLVLRSSSDPAMILPAVKRAINEINPAIVVTSGVFRSQVENSLLRERLMALLSGFFGLLALLLACIGLYGIMSFTVAGRTNEIGIRVALGAEPRDVMWLILRETLVLAGAGVAVGLIAALGITGLASSLLFGLSPVDPVSICLAVLVMLGVAVVAGYIPARRATKVDPMAALRYE